MAETAPPVTAELAQELEAESHAPYMKVWLALAVLTGIEYFYALILKDHFQILVLGLVFLALVKASMVGWYFMHLKFERPWVYILIVPAGVMAVFLTLMLYPDMAMKPPADENSGEEEVWSVPATDFPATPMIQLSAFYSSFHAEEAGAASG